MQPLRPKTISLQRNNISRTQLMLSQSPQKKFIGSSDKFFESTRTIQAKTQNYISRKCDKNEIAQFLQDKLFARSYEYYLMQKNTHNKFIAIKNEYDKPYSSNEDLFFQQLKELSTQLEKTYNKVSNQQERYFYNLLGKTKEKYGKYWIKKNGQHQQQQATLLQIQNERPKLAFIAKISPSKNFHIIKLKEKLDRAIETARETNQLIKEKEQNENLMKALKFNQSTGFE